MTKHVVGRQYLECQKEEKIKVRHKEFSKYQDLKEIFICKIVGIKHTLVKIRNIISD